MEERHENEQYFFDATILDIDERFADVPGYRHFDITRPEWLGIEFGAILCDPPFFNVSFRQLGDALRTLACNAFTRALAT